MIGVRLPPGNLSVLCLAAHPDDIEIGCGGTLLELGARGEVNATFVTLTGTAQRRGEAMAAAGVFLPGTRCLSMDLPDGRLPAHWGEVKQALEDIAADAKPDLILGPSRDDAHQDHRLLAELIPTVWRDALVLEYEIPKWDGDLGRVTTYVAISEENARRKVELLTECYQSQTSRTWWNDEVFLGLMRLRGIECGTQYAEGFVGRKSLLGIRR